MLEAMASEPFRILLVEDEPGDARLMQLALQRAGTTGSAGRAIDLHWVSDGREALAYLHRQGEQFQSAVKPDLILLDLKMPGMGGLEFLGEFKSDPALSDIPVVVVTTSALDSDIQAVRRLGIADYLQKPADLTEFMSMIKRLGSEWFARTRVAEVSSETKQGK